MCNYGRGESRSAAEMIASVREALGALRVNVDELLVSPSGGMLDTTEVPLEARLGIYDLVRNFSAAKFLIETRSETITRDNIQELISSVSDRQLGIEVGLESSCDWVQKFCVNKGSHPSTFQKAADLVRCFGIDFYGNVTLGTAFLTESEAIEDCTRSVRWVLANGGTNAIIFPLHVKPYTLLSWMFDAGLYRPPSLWSLVEVLRRLGPELLPNTEIAWYRSYYDDSSKIRFSPTTCPSCRDEVLRLLDGYRATQLPLWVEQLVGVSCKCKDEWRRTCGSVPAIPLQERVLKLYGEIAPRLDLQPWWTLNSRFVEDSILASFPQVGYGTHEPLTRV
jgi:radical SAM enzyme (TIGR01210 family)